MAEEPNDPRLHLNDQLMEVIRHVGTIEYNLLGLAITTNEFFWHVDLTDRAFDDDQFAYAVDTRFNDAVDSLIQTEQSIVQRRDPYNIFERFRYANAERIEFVDPNIDNAVREIDNGIQVNDVAVNPLDVFEPVVPHVIAPLPREIHDERREDIEDQLLRQRQEAQAQYAERNPHDFFYGPYGFALGGNEGDVTTYNFIYGRDLDDQIDVAFNFQGRDLNQLEPTLVQRWKDAWNLLLISRKKTKAYETSEMLAKKRQVEALLIVSEFGIDLTELIRPKLMSQHKHGCMLEMINRFNREKFKSCNCDTYVMVRGVMTRQFRRCPHPPYQVHETGATLYELAMEEGSDLDLVLVNCDIPVEDNVQIAVARYNWINRHLRNHIRYSLRRFKTLYACRGLQPILHAVTKWRGFDLEMDINPNPVGLQFNLEIVNLLAARSNEEKERLTLFIAGMKYVMKRTNAIGTKMMCLSSSALVVACLSFIYDIEHAPQPINAGRMSIEKLIRDFCAYMIKFDKIKSKMAFTLKGRKPTEECPLTDGSERDTFSKIIIAYDHCAESNMARSCNVNGWKIALIIFHFLLRLPLQLVFSNTE